MKTYFFNVSINTKKFSPKELCTTTTNYKIAL